MYVHKSKPHPPPLYTFCTLLANPPPPLACVRLLWMPPLVKPTPLLFTYFLPQVYVDILPNDGLRHLQICEDQRKFSHTLF